MPAEAYKTSIYIAAPPAAVFPYFTEAESILRWMGDYVVADARPGGEFTANINGLPVRGKYLELDPPHRVVMSWGHAGSDILPPGASKVVVTLSARDGGTRVELEHHDLPGEQTELHAMGWSHYLPRLAIAGTGADPGADPWSITPPPIPDSARSWSEVTTGD